VTSLPEDPPPEFSEEDRETAVQRVREAYAEGDISHEEMDERLHQVLTTKVSSCNSAPAGQRLKIRRARR
jgi:hypothetical protein